MDYKTNIQLFLKNYQVKLLLIVKGAHQLSLIFR